MHARDASTCTSGAGARSPISASGRQARTEFEAALALVDDDRIRRAEVLIELSKCTFWSLDVAAVRRYSDEALTLAESLGRDDLVAETMAWFAGVMNAEGDVPAAVEMDRRAMARVGGPKTFGLARAVISLYHLGLTDEAVTRGYQAVESARASQDPDFRAYALEHLAISLVGGRPLRRSHTGLRRDARVRRRHGVLPMLARGIAMSAGMHISLGDYARGEELGPRKPGNSRGASAFLRRSSAPASTCSPSLRARTIRAGPMGSSTRWPRR